MKKTVKKEKTPKGKMVSGKKYSRDLEEYDDKIGDEDNFPARKPADISGALSRASKKMGYSKKPRVKADKMKGKGK